MHFHHCQKLYRHFQCRVNHSGDAGARLISACPQPKRGRGKLERRRRFTRRTRRRGESQKEKRNIGTNRILPRITIYLCRLRNGEGTTPLGLTGSLGESTQGSLARSATLGWRAQSLWDWMNGSPRDEQSIRFMVPMHAKIRKEAFHEPTSRCEGNCAFRRAVFPPGRMPGSTAGKMPAATTEIGRR